jgi:hypothetical protein
MTTHIADKTIRAACRRGAFGSGETLYMQSGSALTIESGATLNIADGADFNVGDTATPTWADNAELWFGDGNDVDFVFDGTDFKLNAAAASTEFKIEKDFIIKHGAQASVVGSGVPLNATDTTAFAVFSDDTNAAIGSGTLTAAGRFRNLQVYTGGNREQEAAGVRAQLVSVAGTNRHNMAALWGSYECATSLVVDGQAFATDPWIQAAVLGRIGLGSGITTINTNGRLCGVAAMSATASFSSNSGVYTAFYAGHWSGSVDWEYALYAEGIAHGTYINADAGTITGEEHCSDIVNTGTLSSGDSLVGLNIVTTAAGTAGSWVSGLYVKTVQASKMVNGYICAAEIELQSTAAGASDNAVLVLNSTRNHTGSPPACDPYIMLREYGTTYGNVFVRIFGDTGQGATNAVNAALLVSQAKAAHEADCDVVIRCMVGSTPVWLLATTVAPS